METMIAHPVWQSVALGAHRLRNRLVLPPMASQTGDDTGLVTAATVAHYTRTVRPSQGLAFVEYTTVHPWGRSEPQQLALYTNAHEAGLAQLAALIRRQGVVPGIQLTLAGGKTDATLIGRQATGASALAVPAHGGDLPPPAPLTASEITELMDAFVESALRAERAGFAVIEVHATHGYFFNQWLSPITNQRDDAHGGSLAGRAGLLLGLIRRMKAALQPETVVSVRFAAQDRLPGGLTLEDGVWLAQALEAAGVGLLNVSSGLGGWRRGREQRGEGYLVADAAAMRREVGIPVIGVGGIQTLAYAQTILAQGDVDLIAIGRAMLANPDWPWADAAPVAQQALTV
ncbi:MAG: NADH:flavin oxidoreductase [Candidatus Sericytochromatia bacterium]|nr:NADH:flavin oxidoreductase [Candidatus Sericytochromatia bacterium]